MVSLDGSDMNLARIKSLPDPGMENPYQVPNPRVLLFRKYLPGECISLKFGTSVKRNWSRYDFGP
jgi:hypothetical protein